MMRVPNNLTESITNATLNVTVDKTTGEVVEKPALEI